MLCLARGDFRVADELVADAATLSQSWGQSMAGEALAAQAGWLLFETGRLDGLTELLEELPGRDIGSLNEPLWSLGAGLVHAERGNTDQAIRALRTVCASTAELGDLPKGPGRIGILATAAMLLGHPALFQTLPPDWAIRIGHRLADLLTAHGDQQVIAGWPALLLGSKHRHIGLAYLAVREQAKAVAHLARAADENRDFAALHARTRLDLARALLQQPATRSAAAAELEQVQLAATALGMPVLAMQARAAAADAGPS